MTDWNIEESSISCITIDNASNIVKAVEQVLEWSYLPCFGHTLTTLLVGILSFDADTNAVRELFSSSHGLLIWQ